MSFENEMTFEQILENNLQEFLMILAVIIIALFILPKVILFILKIVTKIYETFFMGDNVVKISGNYKISPNSKMVGRKVVIKDKNGNIINEKIDGIPEDIFDRITEQVMAGECISEDGIIVTKNGNKIADFGSRENFEEFKEGMYTNYSENEIPSDGGTLKIFSGEMSDKLASDLRKIGSVKMIKDQYGNTIVEDMNGNVLEGEAKKEAIEIMERMRTYKGSSVKESKMRKEEFEEWVKNKGI